MATYFKLDHDAIARAASSLRDAMQNSPHREIPYFKRLIDGELEHLLPILELCITRQMEEPFALLDYVNPKMFGDLIDFPELTKPYYELARLLRGEMTHEEFWASEYTKERRLPRQLRNPPEYVPSPDTLRKI